MEIQEGRDCIVKKQMLQIQEACAGYEEQEVLKGVSFSVSRGEFAALIGSNGAGKSTLLRCISGLLPLKSGNIEICGKDTG